MGVLVMDADGGNKQGLVNIPVAPGWRCDPGGPTWSPDGTMLAVGGADGIYVIHIADPLSPTNITAAAPDFYDQPAWSPDGTQIAVRVPARGAIGVIPAEGGAAELLTDGSVAPFQPNWSPDGLRIAFQLSIGTGRIGTYDLCTGTTGAITGSFQSVFDPTWSPDGERIAYWGYYGPVAGSGWDVFSSARSGGEPVNLTNTPYPIRESAPDWQPIGAANPTRACGRSLIVNSAADRADTDRKDGRCDTGERVGDKAECTLRAAIAEANQARLPSRITFDIPSDPTIVVDGQLPAIAGRAVLDGTSQPGGWVELDGRSADGDGLRLLGSQSTVRGFVIGGFPGSGIVIGGRGRHEVVGNRIGTSRHGAAAATNEVGIRVLEGAASTIGGTGLSAKGCTGDCNLISGNTGSGILIQGGSDHRITGNLVGLALDGATPLPNAIGIEIRAQDVQVGDDTTAPGTSPGNVVSGNSGDQILVAARADGARVEGNLVGVDISGARPLPGYVGVAVRDLLANGERLEGSPDDVVIGGPTAASRNVVRGDAVGIAFDQVEPVNALPRAYIWSNFIGTDSTGRYGIGGSLGVEWGNLNSNAIVLGSPDATAPGGPMANLISGSEVNIQGSSGVVAGNLIGTDRWGRDAISGGQQRLGLRLIGWTLVHHNLVAGNSEAGIQSAGAHIEDNLIGTDISGERAVPNEDGIVLSSFSSAIEGNLISGNRGWGIRGLPVVGGKTHVAGNLIGTDIEGSDAIPNGAGGIKTEQGMFIGIGEGGRVCYHGAECASIGGIDATDTPCTTPCNIIAGNDGPAIVFDGTNDPTSTLIVVGDYLGIDAQGTDLPNADLPIVIEAAPRGAVIERNRILSAAEAGVMASEDSPSVHVHSNRTDVRTGSARFARGPIPGSSGPSRPPSAVTVPAPDAPAAATFAGGQLTVSGQAFYDSDDAVVLKVYTATECAGPERLVTTVSPEGSANRYEWVGPGPEDAAYVLLQAVPTAGVRGTSTFSECTEIVNEG
jgi:hypothetical protein